jgi:hypothetical protein
VLLGLQRDSESLMDYFDSVVCLLLTLEVRILHPDLRADDMVPDLQFNVETNLKQRESTWLYIH